MIHVVDFEKTAFSTPFRGVLPPSGPQIMAESGMGYPLLGTRETWVVSTVPLATVLPPHAPRSTPHDAGPAGSGRGQTLPRWLLPDTNPRFVKERTGPDLNEHPLYFSMSPNRAIPAENSKFSSPLAAVQPLARSRMASGARRRFLQACLPAGSRSQCLPPPHADPPNQWRDHRRWLLLTTWTEWNQPPFHEALHVVWSLRLIEPNSTSERPPQDSE